MSRNEDDDPGAHDFAARVLDGLVKVQAGEPSSEQDRDVRRLIVGLACIANLVQNYSRTAAGAESGANEALAIIKAITTGQKHPIWEYLEGIRSFKYEPQHAPLNDIDAQHQYLIIGCVRAYLAQAKREHPKYSERRAVRKIADACRLPDLSFDPDRIRGSWIKHYSANAAAMNWILRWEGHVNNMAARMDPERPLLERILEASRRLVWRAWSVSDLQRKATHVQGEIEITVGSEPPVRAGNP